MFSLNPGLHPFDSLPKRFAWRVGVLGLFAILAPEFEALRAQVAPAFGQRGLLKPATSDSSDFGGWSVAIDGNTVVVGAVGEDGEGNSVSTAGSVYVFVKSGAGWVLQATLRAAQADVEDHFGYSVAVQGDTILVGVPYEDSASRSINGDEADNLAENAGAVFVFVRNGSQWTRQAYLKAANADPGDQFGKSVAIQGDRVIVGAWLEDGNGPVSNDDPENNDAEDSGAVYSFVRNGTTWEQTDYVKVSNTGAGDGFGGSVAFGQEGARFVAGALFEDSDANGINGDGGNNDAIESGAAYVFEALALPSPQWVEQYYLKAANSDSGDLFGASVAMDGSTIVVGAPWEASASATNPADNTWTDSGAVYVFDAQLDPPFLAQQAFLKSSHPDPYDSFGTSVAVRGGFLAVGAHGEDGGGEGVNPANDDSMGNSGAVYRFMRSESVWSQVEYLKSSNTGLNHQFGISVAMSGSSVIAGAWRDGTSVLPVSGAAYVFSDDEPVSANQIRLSGSPKFSTTAVRKTSKPKTFVITNTGSVTISNIRVSVTGKDGKQFRVTAPASSLDPGMSTTFSASFKPKVAGKRSATLSVTSSAGSASIKVSGKAK
jgi:hypothetical protein